MKLRRRYIIRSYGVYLHDVIMAGIAMFLALYLRVGDNAFDYSSHFYLTTIGLFTAIAAGVILWQGLHRYIWSYTSLGDALVILRVATYTVLVFGITLFLATRMADFPRSSVLIVWFVYTALLAGPRILYRLFRDRNISHLLVDTHRQVPALLIGAGDGTDVFIRELARMDHAPYHVIGIIDDKGTRMGRKIRQVEVLGSLENLRHVLEKLKEKGYNFPQRAIITRREIAGELVRQLVEITDEFGIAVSRLPELTHLDKGTKIEPRPIAVEDLLGRPQAMLDRQGMRHLIESKRVLVTGAGGTIGSELCRQIAGFNPAQLTVLDAAEYNLYLIHQELSNTHENLSLHQVLADVRDGDRLDQVFNDMAPQLVFHAAALKHVPIVEDNPVEGILTNVHGTQNVAESAKKHHVEVMVMISTDKAINPTSIMGMTKRLAESYCQSMDTLDTATRFVTVRFGNVLGSTGSVVPLFQKQIAQGGPVTVTHPDMQRYFMSTHEAVQLVIQSAVVGLKDQTTSGRIFVLDMGEPVYIVHLARQMIILAGLKPEEDIKIKFTGLRKGEKLFEELFHEGEEFVSTEHAQIFLARPRFTNHKTLKNQFKKLLKECHKQDIQSAFNLLVELTPEYAGPKIDKETNKETDSLNIANG